MSKIKSILMFAACVLMISSLTSCNKSPDDAASGSVSGIATMEKPAVYTVPEGDEKSNDYIISVWTEDNAEKQSVDCFTAKVGTSANGLDSVSYEKMSFCMFDFDFSCPVYISVTPSGTRKNVAVLPESAGAEYSYENGTVLIKITRPSKLSVEFDGDIYHNLFVFAGEYDDNKPQASDENVIYYGPGCHDAGEIALDFDQVLYIDGGAVVYGHITASSADNIRICGSGILDGSKIDHSYYGQRKKMLDITNCKNLVIDGITLRDAPTWGVSLTYCEDVEINNVKQISYNFNSDGFDLMACENVVVDDAFVRNYDDNVSIKANGDRDSRNIIVQNSVLWADCAHNMLVGPEAKSAEYENVFSNITFRNIDVLESKETSEFYRGVMAMTCTDNSIFDGILWEDIRVERMTNSRMLNFRYSTDYGTYVGKVIRNVTVKNVTSKVPPTTPDLILGEEDRHIENVVIENMVVNGKRITHDNNNFGSTTLKFVDSLIIDGVEKQY